MARVKAAAGAKVRAMARSWVQARKWKTSLMVMAAMTSPAFEDARCARPVPMATTKVTRTLAVIAAMATALCVW